MKRLILILAIACFNNFAEGAMSEAQLQSTTRLVRNVCQPKNKATNADIEAMHSGDWNIDRTAMCYMHCVFVMNKLMTKENTFDFAVGMTLLEKSVPAARKEATKISMEQCEHSAKTVNDKCAAAYEIAKCLYESNPANYFLP